MIFKNINFLNVSQIEYNEVTNSYSIFRLKKDCEVKLFVGVSPEEEEEIMAFLNQTEFQKAVLIRRGNDIPLWASKNHD